MPIAARNSADIFPGTDAKTPGLDKLLISRYRTNALVYEIWNGLYDVLCDRYYRRCNPRLFASNTHLQFFDHEDRVTKIVIVLKNHLNSIDCYAV